MRITMGMIANQYKTRLNQSLQALSNANMRATNYRSFNKPSDDPFAAAQTYQVRRETQLNQNYQSNLGNVQDSLKTSESTVRLVSSIVSNADSTDVLGAVNGSMTEDTRSAIVKELRSMRDSIVSDMNAKFSDQYLFGGAGTGSPPFSVDADGNLLYRGVNVDTGVNTNGASATVTNNSSTQIDFGSANAADLKGYSIVVQTGTEGVAVSGNTITVSLDSAHATKGDLQDVLRDSTKWSGDPIPADVDVSKINVSGTPTDAATVSKSGAATQISDDGKSTVTNNSSTQINFGKENAGKLDDYSIVVQTGTEGVAVSGNTITVSLDSAHSTKGDLQRVLQDSTKWSGDPIPDDVDVTKITVAGSADDAATVSPSDGTPPTVQSSQISDKVDLNDLANEKVYVDLGFGLQFDGDGNIVPQSAYNTSLPGISIIGYGMNDDGTPKNVYSLMGKIADLLDSDNVSMDTIQPYLDSFRQTESNITTQISDIGAKEKFLTSTQTHLEDTSDNLTEKDNDVEFVEPSDAIMDWMTQQFCYQAALQMGTNILQPTLMDFLK